jgi:hypothetical protein
MHYVEGLRKLSEIFSIVDDERSVGTVHGAFSGGGVNGRPRNDRSACALDQSSGWLNGDVSL